MRVLQVINAFYPPYSGGGAAHVAHNISKALAGKGHEVTVYTTNALSRESLFDPKQSPYNEDGVEVFYFRNIIYKPQIQIYFSKEFVEAVKKSIAKYDTVHLHEYRSYISLVINYYAKKHNVPYIIQTHGQLPRIVEKQRLKWVYDILFGYRLLMDASKVVAISQMEAEQYRCMGVPDQKIAVIPNGIDLSEYANLPPKGAFRKKFGIDEDEKIVLYLGRIHRVKGPDILAKAFSKVVKELDGVKLVAAGPDDGYLDELESLIRALKIEHDVLIPGPLYGQDKLEAYVDADLFVLPSRYEIWGMTVLEAIACGTPVIVTENCGITDYFTNEVGLVVRAEPNHMAEALLELLLNQHEWNSFRMNCHSVKENLSVSNMASNLEDIYEELLNRCLQ